MLLQKRQIKCKWTICKYLLKMERLLEKQKRNLKAKAIKYHDDPQRKKQAIKKRYEDEKESIKQNKTKS